MKKKYIIVTIITVLLITLGVSYSYFVKENEGRKEIKVKGKEIRIVLKDEMEIKETVIKPGWKVSKRFSVENESKEVFNYNIKIGELKNTFKTEGYLKYRITRDGEEVTEGYVDIPKKSIEEDTVIVYDIDIDPSKKQEYEIELIYEDSIEDQSIDMGSILSGVIEIEEGSIDPNKYYSVVLEVENGRVIGENPKKSLKNGEVEFEVEIEEGYNKDKRSEEHTSELQSH